MSHQADIARQALLESARVAEKHIREKEMSAAYQVSPATGWEQPKDDMDFMDTREFEDFAREQEEQLVTTGECVGVTHEAYAKALRAELLAILSDEDTVVFDLLSKVKERAEIKQRVASRLTNTGEWAQAAQAHILEQWQ